MTGGLAALILVGVSLPATAQQIDCATMVGRTVCEQVPSDRAGRQAARNHRALKRKVDRLVALKRCASAEAAALRGGDPEMARGVRTVCSNGR